MRFSVSSLARLVLVAVVASSAAAIGLARLTPEPRGWRMPAPVRYAGVNAFYLDPCGRGSTWVDREGGPPVDLHLPDDQLFEYASCSPWRDEDGRSQVVGRWSWSGTRTEAPDISYGLARVTFPEGRVLDHVETDFVPVSNPCWYPGTRARILFAAGDGQLYQFDFDAAHAKSDDPARPSAIRWNCEMPHDGGIYMSDPYWPNLAGFSRTLLVVIRPTDGIRNRKASTPSQIWWLRLSEEGDAVEEAGQLLESPSAGKDANERCPSLDRGPDGRPTLAYLRQTGSGRFDLHLSPIEIDAEGGRPRAPSGPGAKVAEDCHANPALFSRDGRWITFVQATNGLHAVIRRRPVDLEAGPAAVAAPSRAAGDDRPSPGTKLGS
jgi:hypothetical protein